MLCRKIAVLLVNARNLQLECVRVLHETLLMPDNVWMEKERSRSRAVQMDNLRGLLGTR